MIRVHNITIIASGKRITRQVISDSSINGGRIALNTITDDIDGAFTLICKPAKRIQPPRLDAIKIADGIIRNAQQHASTLGANKR